MKGSKIKFRFASVLYVCKRSSLSPGCAFIFLVGANEVECEVSDTAARVTNLRKHRKKCHLEKGLQGKKPYKSTVFTSTLGQEGNSG